LTTASSADARRTRCRAIAVGLAAERRRVSSKAAAAAHPERITAFDFSERPTFEPTPLDSSAAGGTLAGADHYSLPPDDGTRCAGEDREVVREEESMKVEAIMKRQVQTCRVDQTLNEAVQIFWDKDCGAVPVLDAEGKLVGMLTDRDVAITAYFRGDALKNVCVADAMARRVLSVKRADDVLDALEVMRTHQVRRLPVVDAEGTVEGIVSLSDLFHAAVTDDHLKAKTLVHAFASICGWREEKRSVVFDVDPKVAASASEPQSALPKRKAKSAKPSKAKAKAKKSVRSR
jgi:CBS domain-containing protein